MALGENLRKQFEKNATVCGCCPTKESCKGGNMEDKIKVAVRNVTFAVNAGEVFGLLGPNGAGKTTTLNMMIADVHPDKGKVRNYPNLAQRLYSYFILNSTGLFFMLSLTEHEILIAHEN